MKQKEKFGLMLFMVGITAIEINNEGYMFLLTGVITVVGIYMFMSWNVMGKED